MADLSWLKALAPTLATALGGPLAGAAVEWISDKLGIPDRTVEGVTAALSGLAPADRLKLAELDAAFKNHLLDAGVQVDLAQAAINLEDAKSSSKWQSGWRPAIGWTGAAAVAYNFVVGPLMDQIVSIWLPAYEFKL
jgi:hypothetical protein